MKAALRRQYGDQNAITIENLEKPVPQPNEILVKVHATTVNRTDCANLTGKPFIMKLMLGLSKPRRIILGTDFSGEIIETGATVKAFKTGDRVFGFFDMGQETQAEYVCIKEEVAYPMPAGVDFKTAAAGLEGAHYAYSFNHYVEIKSGQKILINGATGAIGSALLQFIRLNDVKITATCNTKNIELIKSLGADKIIDFTTDDFTKENEKFDFVFDTVGKSTFRACKPILKDKGIYISSELGPNSENIFYALSSKVYGDKKVIFPIPFSLKKTIPYISELLENGKFKPVIDREYSLDQINEAYKYVLSGQKTGNVIINMQ
ncbi:NADPH:quinone reductase-like Zn-dependent oxidoreductase [Algoriphagus iocasae]|uniref:NADPH:quinone reductase-like Zn-dependent oxidoreductase n=1 Tax=Algoriphagus iocasae TaxID=1836499 RepID=A0A841MJ93_9BACT|nr:NAD(P)-dependent alcohol dehydrogenase [Algoriphagus iocasae]MBB6324934.1 NADPH:quinone reductase-like Zn-dependent oxidoreductase [Algoriphagus iocasae]